MSRNRPVVVDELESRRLLAVAPPNITNVLADNRGEVQITVSRAVTGVNKNSVRFFTAGADGAIGTSDDIRKTDITVKVTGTRITVRGNTDPNAAYRVRLESTLIADAVNGKLLDGEFSGTFPTGNGKSEGNFNFMAKRDRSATPTFRMNTTTGTITLRLRKDVAPVSASAFIDLANSGKLDGFFWTRSVPGFVIQGGSLQVTGEGTSASDVVANSAPQFGQELPRVLNNVRGTLSFARGGPQLNASNQFFINLGNNSTGSSFNNLDVADSPGDAVFTPFAEVISGMDAADAVAAKPTASLPQLAIDPSTGTDSVPVNDAALAQAGVNPNRDLQIARRVAGRMKISALA